MKRLFKTLALLACAWCAAISCGEKINPGENGNETVSPEEQQRRKAAEKALAYLKDDVMSDYYYWYGDIKNVAYTYQTDIYKYFYSILVPQDRWSWMMDGQEYLAEETGIVYGTFGVSLAQPYHRDGDANIYVRFVYPGGPFDLAGVKRGWIITKANNIELPLKTDEDAAAINSLFNEPDPNSSSSFVFRDPDGNIISKTISAVESLNTRPCLKKTIFTAKDYPGLTEPVGYFHYLGFKADNDTNGKSMLDDITEPMAYFKEHGIKTIIVDLRYNGGGDSRASDLLVSYLAPKSAEGQVYVKRMHNDRLKSLDMTQSVTTPETTIAAIKKKDRISLSCEPDSPDFKSLYFITSEGSASASEMVINGLRPLANVHHVGGVTYGKPNGMYVFMYPYTAKNQAAYNKGDYSALQYVFLPICFYNANGLGAMIPDTGLVPDNERPDDLHHDFGAADDNIAACLYHIVNGAYPHLTKAKVRTSAAEPEGGIKVFLTPEETHENYGLYTVRPDFL